MDDYLQPRPVRSAADDRPDALTRLDETNDALAVLRDAFTGEEPLDDALQRLVNIAAKAIPDADAVTVSVADGDRPRTAATTDMDVVAVDERQYSAGRGPCLESARTLKPVRAVVGEHRDRWPEFDAAASETRICAYLSIPVVLPASDTTEAQHVGTLNVYSRTTAAFDPFDEGLMLLFTTAASATITNAQRWQRSRDKIQHLERALESRSTIEQAKGVLMAVHACTADEAFEKLVEESQHKNIKLREVAANLLASVRRP